VTGAESRVKLLGHPIHPMLVVYPVGLLSAAVVFDVLYVATDREEFAVAAFWSTTGGILGGLAAAVFGLLDWLAVPRRTRAKRLGLWHGIGNVAVVGLFGVSWLLRRTDIAYKPDPTPLLFGVAGAGLALVTAWLGGELVYRLRIGVDDDAHPDAKSSLRRGPIEIPPPAP
jgi:uncharacterized membrane protein